MCWRLYLLDVPYIRVHKPQNKSNVVGVVFDTQSHLRNCVLLDRTPLEGKTHLNITFHLHRLEYYFLGAVSYDSVVFWGLNKNKSAETLTNSGKKVSNYSA